MVSHTRTHSKGSFSIFSFDSIRSFGHAGSRQASRIPSSADLNGRIESSLSYRCDPNDQPPASSEVEQPRNNDVVAQSSDRKEGSAQAHSLSGKGDNVQETSAMRSRRRFRPLSWLPWSQSSVASQYPRSQSVHLPKAPSTSTVARSFISAPILTSTTNVDVARTEGVVCGEISDMGSARTRWDPVLGWVANSPEEHNERVPSSEKLERKTTGPNVADASKSPTKMSMLQKRRIIKLGNIIRKRVKGVPVRFRSRRTASRVVHAHNEDTDEHPACGSPDKHLPVGILNLYKGKMRALTENKHLRRKSLNSSKEMAQARQDPPLLSDFADGTILDTEAGVEQSDYEESAFGSLTKSFASAVDKLDFHSPLQRNLPFLRSKSSFFSQKKACHGDKAGFLDRQRHFQAMMAPTPVLEPEYPCIRSMVAAVPEPVKRAANDLAKQDNVPTPVLFSTEANKYVDAKPPAGYPRGVNPLGMHPPDTFASAPSGGRPEISASVDAAASPPPRQTPNPSTQIDDDDDLASLQDAPIYSPSLGDLSQYARDTPPSHRRSHPETSPPTYFEPTPTRVGMLPAREPSTERQGRLLKKSRSGLFSRSKSSKTITRKDKEMANPLHQRDANQQLAVYQGRTVKKSRSLQFGGLFRKNSQPKSGVRVPSEVPFQPTTPSPLRNVTRVSHGSDTINNKVDNGPPRMQFTRQ
ncbi:uncharacterized protein PV06_01974 [Exophiala oligosperma]|uniref:Uncharacterized protein n=1 Tax=Exophiala oligosperma TaxID=215243 RepID=A0A0D2EEE0_9EURO|nr:uncharacterized protein PV06_01974 [Exophiala oligosperma]KIW46294.1 hypothetical protein PV06_01974 [Exophiala oligosperma]